jgi:hypothetical protein
MGQIAERYRRSMGDLRAKVPAATARVPGKSWKSLKKAMEAQAANADVAQAQDPPVQGR